MRLLFKRVTILPTCSLRVQPTRNTQIFSAIKRLSALLVQQAGFVRGNHVLDVDEGVWAPCFLEDLEGLLDQVTNVLALLLAVRDSVTERV